MKFIAALADENKISPFETGPKKAQVVVIFGRKIVTFWGL